MKNALNRPLEVQALLEDRQRILVTGGAGFIGGCLVRRLLENTDAIVFNLDKFGYASDLSSIDSLQKGDRHQHIQVDLADTYSTELAVKKIDPDMVFHLAAESHVDRSIEGPRSFIESNILGTFNLLQAVRSHWQTLSLSRRNSFRFHHISTDEVFGSLGKTGFFSEETPYSPRSPYSASKAASDHLVSSWHHTYGLPVVLTNCSNNFGPWQFPEKLIPLVILKAISGESIPLYGDGSNVRDWLFVEDHVDALLIASVKGELGESYCIGGYGERTNKQVVLEICKLLDVKLPLSFPYENLITCVEDRPGHDHRYAINSSKIKNELEWRPIYAFEEALELTVDWYIQNLDWCKRIAHRSGYTGQRLGND